MKERQRKKRDERYTRRRVGGASRSSDLVLSLACVASRRTGCDRSRGWRHTGTRITSRDAIVGKLQDSKSRHSYLKKKEKSLPYAFNQHHSSLSCPCTRDSHVHVYVYNTFYGLYTRETIHTKDYTHRAKKEKHYNIIFTKCVLPPVPF